MGDASAPARVVTTELGTPPELRDLVGSHEWLLWGPDGGIAGRGVADAAQLPSLAAAEAWLASQLPPSGEGPAPRALLSVPFDAESSMWPVTVVVPAEAVVVRDGRAWRVNVSGPGGLTGARPDTAAVPTDDGPRYRAAVAAAVAAIRAGELSKVVLATAVDEALPPGVGGGDILAALAERYARCWLYSVDGLVGASPELLVRRTAGRALSRVLAGTVPQGPDTPTLLAEAMTPGGKNRREHAWAVTSAVAALEPLAHNVTASPQPYPLHLANVAHLTSDVHAELRPGVGVLQLLAALHPTAAVCGTPTAVARQRLRAWEGFDRGRYAGPVGWCDATGDGEFAIALRGGQLLGEHIRLFAGAGIVDGSDPDAEWQEVQHKLRPMRDALAAHTSSAAAQSRNA